MDFIDIWWWPRRPFFVSFAGLGHFGQKCPTKSSRLVLAAVWICFGNLVGFVEEFAINVKNDFHGRVWRMAETGIVQTGAVNSVFPEMMVCLAAWNRAYHTSMAVEDGLHSGLVMFAVII